ncbi:ribonuclease III domain-containing protein [Powellomyces hirtus]|nr:ribonuclease III domain-containing protein [Powellomyces hirtus]
MRSFFLSSRQPLLRRSCQRPLLTPLRSYTTSATHLSPAESAAFSTFAQQNGLQLTNSKLLSDALTHSSFLKNSDTQNDRLSFLGHKVLSMYAAEHVHTTYPDIPAESVNSVVEQLTGPEALQAVGRKVGIPKVMRWKVSEKSIGNADNKVTSSVLQALIGALYLDQGAAAAKEFIVEHFFSRPIDASIHTKMADPKALLDAIVRTSKRERPVARILREAGGGTPAAIYMVGLFQGDVKLGDGYGSSREQAESRAVRNALRKHFKEEIKAIEAPSGVEEESITFFP